MYQDSKPKSVRDVWRQDLLMRHKANLDAQAIAQHQTQIKPNTAGKILAVTKDDLEVVLAEYFRSNPRDEALTNTELLPKLNAVLAANNQKTSASQIKKCDRYKLACEDTGRGRKKPEITQQRHRREPIEMLDKLISQHNRASGADAGDRVRGRVIQSRD